MIANRTTSETKGNYWVLIALAIVLVVSIIIPGVSALPAGFQEFFAPMPADLTQDIFVAIDNNPAVSNGMHYVVGVTASADNTVVYYDHWENGYLTGAAGDVVVPLSKGQVYKFESGNVPSSPRGTSTFFDGGDRVFVSGSLLQFVVSTWPEDPGVLFTDAWEVYPANALSTSYDVPVGENLGGDFGKTYVIVQATQDGTSVQIDNPGTGL